jgi:hypothetical protein
MKTNKRTSEKVLDAFSVKLRPIPSLITEASIKKIMSEFGEVVSCWIPPEQPYVHFAVVRFRN